MILKKNQTELSGRSVVGPSHMFFTVLTAAFFINTIYIILLRIT